MRSSIACIRCRRSKVKCVNNGVGTTCRSCENSGRECTYPSPITGAVKRRESLSLRPDVPTVTGPDGERRQRARKSAHTFIAHPATAPRESPRPRLDALDPKVVRPATWQRLFEIFQTHYSVDLPFIHSPSFLRPLRAAELASLRTESDAVVARPPGRPEFLLAFLALTARFHPNLVEHHSPRSATRPSNPVVASEYYAAAAHERLAASADDESKQDLQRVQALLMLGLHEWGMCRGAKAWVIVGTAIRSAQAMGMQFEQDLDDEPWSRALPLDDVESTVRDPSGATMHDEGEDFIRQEIRRRTFWSCYMMDRYLSSGKYRPQMLRAPELRLQLPASERAFLFAEKVRTLMLGEEEEPRHHSRAEVLGRRRASVSMGRTLPPLDNALPSMRDSERLVSDDEKAPLEVGSDEGLVSRYVKLLEIYGRVVKWACAGGRKTEQYPPWDSRSTFSRLHAQCASFKATLPRQHTLTPQNTQAHISLKTSTPYTLVHMLFLLSQIMLLREYLPFLPFTSISPQGTLDHPSFPADRYDVPSRFWDGMARDCFKAARDIIDLARGCREWSVLVETPIVGFAVYTAALLGVYSINFRWMDPEGFLSQGTKIPAHMSSGEASKGFEASRRALEMVAAMRNDLRMAQGWLQTLRRTHRYLRRITGDYRRHATTVDQSTSENIVMLDAAPEEYRLLEQSLREHGGREDEDVEMADVAVGSGSQGPDVDADDDDDGSSLEDSLKSEDADPPGTGSSHRPRSDTGGAWSAINIGPSAMASSSRRQENSSTPTSGQFRSYESYQHPSPTHPSAQQSTAAQQQSPATSSQWKLADYRRTMEEYVSDEKPRSVPAFPPLNNPTEQSTGPTSSTPAESAPPRRSLSSDRPTQSSWVAQNHTSNGNAHNTNHSNTNNDNPPPSALSPRNHHQVPYTNGTTYTTTATSSAPHHPQGHHYQQQQHPPALPSPSLPPPAFHQNPPSVQSRSLPSPNSLTKTMSAPQHLSSQQSHHQQQQQQPSLSREQRTSYVRELLEMRFSADDLVVFVEGADMRTWAGKTSISSLTTTPPGGIAGVAGRNGGWLALVW